MIRGLYLAGTGMVIQRSRMDVITNNITNVDTLGYKKDMLLSRSFEDMLIDRMNDPSIVNQTTTVGPLGTGVHIDEMTIAFGQGTPEQISISTDLCLVGDGFFVVNTPEGERYTRAGNFSVDVNGNLVDSQGNYVQGTNGNITVTNENFLIKENGEIWDLETDAQVGTLRMVEFEDVQQLRKTGGNMFTIFGNMQPQEAENTKVMQGYIETSNVNIAQEMVDMIITNRAYESSQQAVKMIDQTLNRTVNDIARF